MAVPSFLNSSYRYLERASVTDVDTCITDFRSETVTNGSPQWTEPTANQFKSPPLPDGQYFIVVLSRISATRLGIKILDMLGNTVADRAIDIDAAGTTVRCFTGQCHAWIDSARATPECGGGALVDISPDGVGLQLYRTIAWGTRDTSGAVNNAACSYWYMWDNAASSNGQRVNTAIAGSSYYTHKTVAGSSIFQPLLITTNIFGSNTRWVGRPYQMLTCPDDLGYGAEIDVPIDAGVTGRFRVIARGAETNGHFLVAVRRTTP